MDETLENSQGSLEGRPGGLQTPRNQPVIPLQRRTFPSCGILMLRNVGSAEESEVGPQRVSESMLESVCSRWIRVLPNDVELPSRTSLGSGWQPPSSSGASFLQVVPYAGCGRMSATVADGPVNEMMGRMEDE